MRALAIQCWERKPLGEPIRGWAACLPLPVLWAAVAGWPPVTGMPSRRRFRRWLWPGWDTIVIGSGVGGLCTASTLHPA